MRDMQGLLGLPAQHTGSISRKKKHQSEASTHHVPQNVNNLHCRKRQFPKPQRDLKYSTGAPDVVGLIPSAKSAVWHASTVQIEDSSNCEYKESSKDANDGR